VIQVKERTVIEREAKTKHPARITDFSYWTNYIERRFTPFTIEDETDAGKEHQNEIPTYLDKKNQ
jgi:hypothetical protein